jgi:hypothetical protein
MGRINNENSSRSILPKQYERAAHLRSGGLLYLGVHPAWWLTLRLTQAYPWGMERLSQSSKRVGPMRGLAPGVSD